MVMVRQGVRVLSWWFHRPYEALSVLLVKSRRFKDPPRLIHPGSGTTTCPGLLRIYGYVYKSGLRSSDDMVETLTVSSPSEYPSKGFQFQLCYLFNEQVVYIFV